MELKLRLKQQFMIAGRVLGPFIEEIEVVSWIENFYVVERDGNITAVFRIKSSHLYLPFPMEWNGSSTAWNIQLENLLSVGKDNSNIAEKITDNNLQPNRTKISLSFGYVPSIAPSEKAKSSLTSTNLLKLAVINELLIGDGQVPYCASIFSAMFPEKKRIFTVKNFKFVTGRMSGTLGELL
uniref:Uncharacterized protein n=1 Tax=Romanomermis culicivorax TaxID=13658 RepID=A0A915IJY9_ROMCU